ncbi:hypothetical protein NXS98_14255 [Fontisphaera persica]|uniref:hypothetical protein n=1 Tax=Fontisphaera persica TaxID=2974023 RepID=UPI0024BF204E|nr:hypothetical protein [Fontisphaera persica]WCJ58871.1 hypothetical protein NXS98_14255 [Fontisphaera persica]
MVTLKIKTNYNIPPNRIMLREVCLLLHISQSTAKRRIKSGDLAPCNPNGPGRRKPLLFDLEQIRALAGPGAPNVEYVPMDENKNGGGLISVKEALRHARRS